MQTFTWNCRRQQIHITTLQKIQQDRQSNNKAVRGGGGGGLYPTVSQNKYADSKREETETKSLHQGDRKRK